MIFPTHTATAAVVRDIIVRERIEIVHGHGAFSLLCHEVMMLAQTIGVRTVFTDHSLFGFADISGIVMNNLLRAYCQNVNHVICVSHTSKENTVLRADLPTSHVSVIPNAIDPTYFTPDPAARDPTRITCVVISRLFYRKGVDLLLEVIPALCAAEPRLDFLIGGDGPKRVALEEMRERHQLQDRVTLLGAIAHKDVRSVLVQGDLFLNVSLTEAFCIAIIEAASCGLLVVSTRVGGIPEVLPSDMLVLADPVAEDLADKVLGALERASDVSAQQTHDRVKNMYSWANVAERTEVVYERVWKEALPSLFERLQRAYQLGPVAGKVLCCLLAWLHFLLQAISWLRPASEIDLVPDATLDDWKKAQQADILEERKREAEKHEVSFSGRAERSGSVRSRGGSRSRRRRLSHHHRPALGDLFANTPGPATPKSPPSEAADGRQSPLLLEPLDTGDAGDLDLSDVDEIDENSLSLLADFEPVVPQYGSDEGSDD